MTARVIGARELALDLETMQALIENPEPATEQLDELMTKHVPVQTGHLKSTIYHKNDVAGAKAAYAGYVEEMGKEYAYGTQAIKGFDINEFADRVTEPF